MIQYFRRPLIVRGTQPFRGTQLRHADEERRPMKVWVALGLTLVALAVIALLPTGCKHTVDDATLTTNVKSALTSDAAIGQQPIQVAAQAGVVTLTGNVSDETASSVAAQDAAKVAGVKEVVNDLTVAGLAVTPTVTSPSAPAAPRPVTHQERIAIAQHQSLPPPPANAPPPPQPVYRDVTVDAGRDIGVRITQSFDSETAQDGMPFSGVVTRPIVVDGFVAIPAGAAVSGRVVDAKDATHFKGSSLLSLQLTSIRRHGDLLQVSTDPYTVEGKGRGTNTAEKIGGGAAIGAVLGGIFGGGKGAAIGAGAGAGGGTILQGSTRGQQVTIPSESVLNFRLNSPITVHTADQAGEEDAPPQGLQPR
jgi:hypothetical protein